MKLYKKKCCTVANKTKLTSKEEMLRTAMNILQTCKLIILPKVTATANNMVLCNYIRLSRN